jgi:glycosyltransferase involved in cell wall biosynthesis
MSEQPYFSVVIPVYNRAQLLGRALKSVLAQTFGDFEIVVVDDGSTDNPSTVIDALWDDRIYYLRQGNRGGGAARNLGIDAAHGRFVAFLDSDDEFLPGHLAALKALLDGTVNTAAYARIIVDRGEGRSMVKPPRALRPGEHMATYLMAERGFVPTITLAVETEAAKRVRYHEDLRAAEDTDFAIRLALEGVRFVMAEEPGAVWHDLPDPSRASLGRTGTNLADWLETLRAQIPARAYHGYRGWAIAKVVAMTHPMRALKLYATALFRGCYRPRLAAVVFLQVFLPDGLYRRIADRAIAWMGLFRRGRETTAPLADASLPAARQP